MFMSLQITWRIAVCLFSLRMCSILSGDLIAFFFTKRGDCCMLSDAENPKTKTANRDNEHSISGRVRQIKRARMAAAPGQTGAAFPSLAVQMVAVPSHPA
jgi:hypothetical protein